MNQGTWNYGSRHLRGIYRDRENGWVFGVCAGVADRYNFRLGTIRVIAIICLLLFFWFTVAVYFAAVVLISEKPLVYAGNNTEDKFWRGV